MVRTFRLRSAVQPYCSPSSQGSEGEGNGWQEGDLRAKLMVRGEGLDITGLAVPAWGEGSDVPRLPGSGRGVGLGAAFGMHLPVGSPSDWGTLEFKALHKLHQQEQTQPTNHKAGEATAVLHVNRSRLMGTSWPCQSWAIISSRSSIFPLK